MHTITLVARAEMVLKDVLAFIATAPTVELAQIREKAWPQRRFVDEAIDTIQSLDPVKDEADLNRIVVILDGKGYYLVTEVLEMDDPFYELHIPEKLTPGNCISFRVASRRNAAELNDAQTLQDILNRHGVEDVVAALQKGGLDG